MPTSQTSSAATVGAFDQDHIWSRWSADQYALIQDGDDLWIGSGSGVLRWNTVTNTQRRYTTLDGLPSYRIFAVAVDGMGNRWFGGDGGLSRLDAAEQWTHFTAANSGLHTSNVVGIAVGADGTLWLSHGLPAGSVSRRDPDGTWHWAPNRAVAVSSDYPSSVQTRNVNPLWTVTGAEVWAGYSVYDGVEWIDRTPLLSRDAPPDAMVAHDGQVWVLAGQNVLHWTGTAWEDLGTIGSLGSCCGMFYPTALTFTSDAQLWIGGTLVTCIKIWCRYESILVPFEHQDLSQNLGVALPVTALLPVTVGLWAIGAGWLRSPTASVQTIIDAPTATVDHVIAGGDGLLWLHSTRHGGYAGTSQGLDDKGTAVLGDDQWQPGIEGEKIVASDRTPAGDVWLALEDYNYDCPIRTVVRRHQGHWLEYDLPITDFNHSAYCPTVTDIFAQDERYTWFAYVSPHGHGSAESGVLRLDDDGTPAQVADDQWTNYPFPALNSKAVVAVDNRDRLWLGTMDGLYRWISGSWQKIGGDAGSHICELTPAADGFLLAQGGTTCGSADAGAMVIETKNDAIKSTNYYSVDDLLSSRWDVAQATTRRNTLFARGEDGDIWYFKHEVGIRLCQRSSEVLVYCEPLPDSVIPLGAPEVDHNNHLWLAAGVALWRLTPVMGFALYANPPSVWMTPAAARATSVHVQSVEGFAGPITLTLAALPNGLTATVTPATVTTGASATLVVTTSSAIALGDHPITVRGVGAGVTGMLTSTLPITVRVTAEVHTLQLPLVTRQ